MSSIEALSSTTSTYWEEIFGQTKSAAARQGNDFAAKTGRDGGDLATKLFTDLDTDGDSVLSLEESGLDQETYDSMDADQDGVVTLAELENALELQRSAMMTRAKMEGDMPPPPSGSEKPDAQALLASLMNGEPLEDSGASAAAAGTSDGLASQLLAALDDGEDDETASGVEGGGGAAQTVFDAMDTDQDGTVSAAELAAALEKRKESMGEGRDPSLGAASDAYSSAAQQGQGGPDTRGVDMTA